MTAPEAAAQPGAVAQPVAAQLTRAAIFLVVTINPDPNNRSHASDPIPITQDRPASRSRNSTARIKAGRSAQNDRTAVRLSGPGFIVTTRKIAARVSGADTGCATAIASISERASELASGRAGPMAPRIKTERFQPHAQPSNAQRGSDLSPGRDIIIL